MSGLASNAPPSREAARAAVLSSDDQTASTGLNHDLPEWTPASWTSKPIKQDALYSDRKEVERALAKLECLPPIVTVAEICILKNHLRDVALGKAFLLQGGDCAELFDYCEENSVDAKIKLLLQMSLVLIHGARKPVIRIARMAGQYAKPRSSPTEVVNGEAVPSFRGDILNGYDLSERQLDPSRLVSAYFHSAATLNYIRAQLSSGFADLHRPLDWDLGHVRDKNMQEQYQRISNAVTDSLSFMRTVGTADSSSLKSVELFTSHEALLLEYEQSLTRLMPMPPTSNTATTAHTDLTNGTPTTYSHHRTASRTASTFKAYFNTSAHFLWIGDRTRQLDGAHIEYIRGIENPIGIKVGPSLSSTDLVQLLNTVNPSKDIGKVTLITRYGSKQISSKLGAHIDAVKASGHIPVWQCDPMHGNTQTTSSGIKTRHFQDILSEVAQALRIHEEHDSFLGGVHLELTGEAVTECVGGAEGLMEKDLSLNYTTFCDPRLNEKQALELAFLVTGFIRGEVR